MPKGGSTRSFGSRRLIVASIALGIFVLVDLGLLGWFIFRSLSKREIERVLLETRREAEEVADQLAGTVGGDDQDLYTLIASESEKQTYIDTILQRREIIKNVEIRDVSGRLVFRARGEQFDPPGEQEEPVGIEAPERPREIEGRLIEQTETINYDMEIPIGDLGVLFIGISQAQLQERVDVLRGELTRQTSVLGAVTVVVLILAYLTIWWLWRRSQHLEEQAAEAERMAYIGTLASGLAHEIRNPLNSLNLNMQMLEEDAAKSATAGSSRRLFAVTQQEIKRLERLVTDFLSYAKPRPLEMREVSAVELLESCRDLLGAEFDKRGAQIVVEDLSQGGKVRVDSEQLTQLLMNLAQNALAATEESDRPPRIILRARPSGGAVYLEVEDNGVGIPSENTEQIFDLFYSTRKGGTGLGLAVVKRIATDHSGEVEVESTPGVGTRVRVSLPRVEKAGRPEPAGEALAASGSG
jgi:signal transduction histidine kinase